MIKESGWNKDRRVVSKNGYGGLLKDYQTEWEDFNYLVNFIISKLSYYSVFYSIYNIKLIYY